MIRHAPQSSTLDSPLVGATFRSCRSGPRAGCETTQSSSRATDILANLEPDSNGPQKPSSTGVPTLLAGANPPRG